MMQPPVSLTSQSVNWVNQIPSSPEYLVDTDVLNDIDDVLALTHAARAGMKMRLVTTTLYDPRMKAWGATLILRELGQQLVPVFAGHGFYPEENGDFQSIYPAWPQKYGIPGKTNRVSLFQGKSYQKHFPDFVEKIESVKRGAVHALASACRESKGNLVLVSLAPPSNMAQALKLDPDCMDGVNRLVMMGGFYEHPNGDILRLGYNTAVDLRASQTLLEQKKIPVLIVNSELCKRFQFVLKDKEREVLRLSPCKTKLGEAVCEDMHSYWEYKIPPKGELGLADVLTTYLARNPGEIKVSQAVQLTFDARLLDVTMDHPDAHKVIKVKMVAESNIHIVRELHDHERVRKMLVASMLPLFYPGASCEQFYALLDSTDDPQTIANKLKSQNC